MLKTFGSEEVTKGVFEQMEKLIMLRNLLKREDVPNYDGGFYAPFENHRHYEFALDLTNRIKPVLKKAK